MKNEGRFAVMSVVGGGESPADAMRRGHANQRASILWELITNAAENGASDDELVALRAAFELARLAGSLRVGGGT